MKDPAFLFYSNDFDSGTKFFTDEQTGKYIRLMIAQHQHGHLSEQQMLFICKTYDKDVFDKFIKDNDGKYYNERLETEIEKRKLYTQSRRDNRLKNKNNPKTYEISYDKHMIDHMENENENENENEDEIIIDDKTWKDDYNIYLEEATDALAKLKQDTDWMSNQEKFNPNILIVETLDKSFYNYWGTEAGWKNKKKLKTKDINWKSTYANAMSNPVNKVYKPRDNSQPTTFYKNSKGQLLHETEWIENGKRYYGKRGGKCYEVPMDLEPRPSTQYSLSFSQAMQCKVWVIN